jgi:hypothetical protein
VVVLVGVAVPTTTVPVPGTTVPGGLGVTVAGTTVADGLGVTVALVTVGVPRPGLVVAVPVMPPEVVAVGRVVPLVAVGDGPTLGVAVAAGAHAARDNASNAKAGMDTLQLNLFCTLRLLHRKRMALCAPVAQRRCSFPVQNVRPLTAQHLRGGSLDFIRGEGNADFPQTI